MVYASFFVLVDLRVVSHVIRTFFFSLLLIASELRYGVAFSVALVKFCDPFRL